MDEPRRDECVLQLRGNPLVDAQDDAEQHGGMRRGQGRVESFGVASAQPPGKSADPARRAGHLEARCL